MNLVGAKRRSRPFEIKGCTAIVWVILLCVLVPGVKAEIADDSSLPNALSVWSTSLCFYVLEAAFACLPWFQHSLLNICMFICIMGYLFDACIRWSCQYVYRRAAVSERSGSKQSWCKKQIRIWFRFLGSCMSQLCVGKHIKNKKRKKRKRLINLRKWCDRVTALRRVLIPCRVVAGRRYRHSAHKCPKPSCWWLPHKRRSDDPVVPDAPCIVVHQNIDYATAQVSDCDAHEHVGIWQEHCVDSLRGGGGGAAATRRKRDERALLEVLTKVLSDFAGTNSPAAPLHPKPPKPKPNSPRQDTLLDALKKIVQRAEKHPDQLLPKLTNLVSAANAGKMPLSSAEPAVPSASVPVGTKSKGAAKGKGKGAGKMTPESASPPADREQSANPASWVEVVNRSHSP